MSNEKSDEPVMTTGDLIRGVPDTLKGVARALVKSPPAHEWKLMKGKTNPAKMEID